MKTCFRLDSGDKTKLVPARKLARRKKKKKDLNFVRKLKKQWGSDTNQIRSPRNNPKEHRKETEGIGDPGKDFCFLDNCTIEIG